MSEKEFHPGDEIGGFAILAACGAGAFGQVYLVRDAKGRRFALKVLSPDRRGEREECGGVSDDRGHVSGSNLHVV